MKIIIAGDYHSPIYEQAFFDACMKAGYQTEKFSWWQYFHGYQYGLEKQRNIFKKIYYKFQNKYLVGPAISRLNSDLLSLVKKSRPDLVFIYRGTHIRPATIEKIKAAGSVVFGYNNDDPFSDKYQKYVWRHFIASIKLYDHLFIYRQKNAADLEKIGYDKFSQLRSYYIKENNFFIESVIPNKYTADVLFAGHFEDDGRDKSIKMLLDDQINIKLYGGESWQASKYYGLFTQQLGPIDNLNKEEYNLAINSAAISLVFLSKRNNDSYTRRCFEIPAAKGFMLSEYTEDLNSLFKEDEEAAYFRTPEELLQKARYYLAHPEERKKIAAAGYERLMRDGHEVSDRIKEIIRVYNQLKK